MTRFTNFARKRTYVEAGFNNEQLADPEGASVQAKDSEPSGDTVGPEVNKRKRGSSKKTKFVEEETTEKQEGDDAQTGQEAARSSKKTKHADKSQRGSPYDKGQSRDSRKLASEHRRLKRIDERHSDTICFACREKGHTARDCRNTLAADAIEGERNNSTGRSGRDAVGICYRCGSRRHNLSRCKEPIDSSNPLPFASCFVCSGKGHLASKCPKNQSKGIYPNGGCCKLCKETTHLAKDCPLRKQEVTTNTLFVGTGQGGGADEDDFHTFKRMTVEVDKSERSEVKAKRKAEVKVGAHSGVVKAFGAAPAAKKKKVVVF
ncbi:hypothetical protein C8Q80DRAFT_1218106 [Daedaleopsis nitida]|nr:hypothetical protein C8Q80DRAFT_1218106 [Daedaleopsis nitida]